MSSKRITLIALLLSAVVLPLVVYADGINGTAGGPVGLWANAVEALHIDSSQHVGIGTTTALSQLLTVWGNIDSGNASGFLTEIANAGTTGTTVNKLAKLNTSGTAVIAATTDTDGMIGVVVGSAGTSGNAQIAVDGQAVCVFDGATTAGDFVTISSTTAGDCHDAGSARPGGSQSIGRVLSTNGSGGSYVVSLGLGGTSAGNIPVGTISAFASTTCPTGWTVYSPAVGRFLRGIDTAANTSDTQNRTPGATETDMMQGHKHSVTTNGSIASTMVPDGLSSYGAASSNWSVGTVVIGNPTGDGTNGTPRTGLETRPVNVAVTFCQYAGTAIVTAGITAAGTTNYVARWTSATTIGTGVLYDNGSNVGIGTTSPNTGAAFDLSSNTNSLLLPVGTTGQEPASPVNGMIRYNSSSGVQDIEAYINGAWTSLTIGGTGGSLTLGTSAAKPNPTSSFSTTTGLFSDGTSAVATTIGGTERMRVNASGVGINTNNPMSMLQVNGGEVQIGSSGASCTTNNAGAIRYSGTTLYYCNASTWTATSAGGGGGTVNIGSQYQMAYYTTTGTAVTGDASVVTDASNNLQVISGNIAVGTSNVSNAVTLDGQAGRTVGMIRDMTANTAGNNLTIQAGGAFSGGTDKTGGNLILSSGISTGTNSSNVQVQVYPAATGSSGVDNTATTALTISETGSASGGTGSFGNQAITAQATANSGTDKNGATLNLSSGVSTGTGSSGINFNIYKAASTSSSANAATTAMTISSAGNVGIGTATPAAMGSGSTGIQIDQEMFLSGVGNQVLLGLNMYQNGAAWKNIATDISAAIRMDTNIGGIGQAGIAFYAQPSAAAGSTLTPDGQERMVILTNGNVGIGTNAPNASALLDTYSTTQGVLLPRVTTTQMNAISSPAAGLTVYNTTANALYSYNGSSWVLSGGAGAVTLNRIVFGTSGSNNTYTPSANTAYIVVKVIGGGGGGGGSGTGSGGSTGGTGGTSCFESASDGCSTYILKATGGTGGAGTGAAGGGGGGSGTGGSINITGGAGGGDNGCCVAMPGGNGGNSVFGGGQGITASGNNSGGSGAANTGGGGAGASTSAATGGGVGGGAGGYSETVISSPSGTYYYTVGGAGGAGSAGTSGGIGGAGAAGVVIIYEYTTIGYSPNVGTLTANDYCSANSGGTQITCTTASTGSNNVVLSGSPTLTGTITAAAANFSGNVGISTSNPMSMLQVNGGEVQVGSSGASCNANTAGAIRYSGATLYYCNASAWTSAGGGGGGTTLNGITAATANQSGIANGANTIQWNWDTLAGGSALTLATVSTAAASSAQTLLNLSLSGTNATSSQHTYGEQISNTHNGTSSSNIGLSVTVSGGTGSNYGVNSTITAGVAGDAAVWGQTSGAISGTYGVYGGNSNSTNLGYGVYSSGTLGVAGVSATAGTPLSFYMIGANNTGITASTEAPVVHWALNQTQTWATGALTTERVVLIDPPTIAFAGASTLTDVATVGISGAPKKGTNATLTNTHALLISAGAVSTAANSFGMTVNAQTGATRNYAAQFLGGNVGVGTSSPANTLDVNGSLAVGTYAGTAAGASNELIVSGNAGIGTASPAATLNVETTNAGSSTPAFEFTSGGGNVLQIYRLLATSTAELQTGTNLVLQPTSGNVGIGTTSPISILDVRTGTGHRVSMRDASLIGGLSTAGMIEAYNDAGSATIPLEIESSTLLLNSISGGTVGIGTVTPDSPLTVSSNTSGLQPPGGGANGTILHIAGVDGTNSRVLLDSYGTSAAAYLSIRAARGTAASPSALQSGDLIGGISARGYETSAYSGTAGSIFFTATENWTNTANGNAITFQTTANTTVGSVERMRVDQSGNVGIGNTSPSYTLDVTGNLRVSSEILIPAVAVGGSTVCLNGYLGLCSSDARLKHDITYLTDGALSKIMALKPARFVWNNDTSNFVHAGFIAQDTLPTIPEAVGKDIKGHYTWDSNAIVSYAVKAVQELKALFDALAADVAEIKKHLAESVDPQIAALKASNDNQAKEIDALRNEFEAYKKAHP